jgi:acetyltransferase-like isoleucine patch superfamily enzyme
MSLGENVIIHDNCWLTTTGEGQEENRVKLEIRAGAAIGMGATIAAAEKVVLGERVLLARNVYIADHAHAYQNIHLPIADQGLDTIKPVSIGKGTWLGQNAVVLPGVSIGEHCVIGANSVVNRSIADFSVAVGAPARVIRTYNQSSGQWEKVA